MTFTFSKVGCREVNTWSQFEQQFPVYFSEDVLKLNVFLNRHSVLEV